MSNVTASAPGKVVLCGEYAVLDGAPAISLAVNRRATVSIEAIDGENNELHSKGSSEPGDFALFDAVLRQSAPDSPQRYSAMLDTSPFANGGTKLGIGSSGALTAALTAALAPPGTDRSWVFEHARLAHKDFQQGVGSGVDVATSCAGGLVAYRIDGPAPRPLRWPDDLCWSLLWSGTPANTRDKVRKLGDDAFSDARKVLATEAESAAAAWSSGDATSVLEATARYTVALQEFSDCEHLDVFGAGHEALAKSATPDIVYKPCGAGGGDVGIVLGTNGASVASFAQAAEARGFKRLDIGIDETGVRVHEQE